MTTTTDLMAVLQLVHAHPALEQLLQSANLSILRALEICQFEPGEFQLNQGSVYHDVYLIVTGQVKIYLNSPMGRSVTLDIYDTGMLIGEQEAIIKQPYSASVVNLTPVTLLKIKQDLFQTWIATDHQFATALITNLSQQIYQLTNRTKMYTLYSTLDQVGMLLLQAPATGVNKLVLCDQVDSSQRNLNRVLQKLTQLGIITLEQATVKVRDRQRLRQLIETEEGS